jgi:hypothetical protein
MRPVKVETVSGIVLRYDSRFSTLDSVNYPFTSVSSYDKGVYDILDWKRYTISPPLAHQLVFSCESY